MCDLGLLENLNIALGNVGVVSAASQSRELQTLPQDDVLAMSDVALEHLQDRFCGHETILAGSGQ